jgi:drug/metabolite transporter (DMT)-like permease
MTDPLRTPRKVVLQRALALLFLTLAWGGNWPVAKLGVTHLPPLWFRLLGTTAGVLVLLFFARMRGIDLVIPRGARIRVALLSIPNMVLWYSLATWAIVLLPPGRAAILGFTMPAWAALFGFWFGGDKPDRLGWMGVAAGAAAALLLIGSTRDLGHQPLGVALILSAAAAWAFGTVALRRWPVDVGTVALTFWMLVSAALTMLVLSALLEFRNWVVPDLTGWLAVLYNGALVVGFGNMAWFDLARRLPAWASGLSSMMIPVVGVFSSMLVLGEHPASSDWVALVLVLAALVAAVAPRPRRSP